MVNSKEVETKLKVLTKQLDNVEIKENVDPKICEDDEQNPQISEKDVAESDAVSGPTCDHCKRANPTKESTYLNCLFWLIMRSYFCFYLLENTSTGRLPREILLQGRNVVVYQCTVINVMVSLGGN